MYDLKCGQKDCRHNHGYCCCAKCICVSQGTECTTYEKSQNDHKTEASAEFTKPDNSVDTSVDCTAPCLFNRSNKCVANGITVSTAEGGSAECLTFIKK